MSDKTFWWSNENVTYLKEMYGKIKNKEIAEKLGTTILSVSMKGGRLGLQGKREILKYEWTEQMLADIKRLFPTSDRKTLVDTIGLPFYAIQTKARRLKLINTSWQKRGAATKAAAHKSCDIHFFDEWNNESAYAMGFLQADGSVRKDGSAIVVAVVSTDECVLDYLKKITKSTRSFYYLKAGRNGTNCGAASWMTLQSKILVQKAMEKGLFPRKTYNDFPFPKVPDEFLASFIRGNLDGDGSICVTSQNVCKVSFVGTPRFVKGIRDSLVRLAKMKYQPVKLEQMKTSVCGHICWAALKDLKAFSSFIYPPGHGFCLERKKRKLFGWLESKTQIDKE